MNQSQKIPRSFFFASIAASLALGSTAQADDYVLRASDGGSTSSFTTPYTGSPGGWATTVGGTDVGAPTSGNNYTVTEGTLRTPDDDPSSYTFGGDSLTLDGTNSQFYLLGGNGATYTVGNLILKEGRILHARTASNTLAGAITLDGAATFETTSSISGNDLTIDSTFSGSGTLTFVGGSNASIIINKTLNSGIDVVFNSPSAPDSKGIVFMQDTQIGNLSSLYSAGRVSFDQTDTTLTVNQTTDGTFASRLVGKNFVMGSGSTASLTLTKNNNFIRTSTTIEGGNLIVGDGTSGAFSSTTAVSVDAGALSGSLASGNNFAGDVIIGDGSGTADAILTAGTASDVIGRIGIAGDLDLDSDSEFVFNLLTTSGSVDADQVIVGDGSGETTITGSSIFTLLAEGDNSGLTIGQTFTAIDGGSFNGVFSNLYDGQTITSNGISYLASYDGGDLILEVSGIPEPAVAAILLSIAAFGMVLRRRRQA